MSIDYEILNWQCDSLPQTDEEGEFVSNSMGSRDLIRQKISACYPKTEWEEPRWGTLEYNDHLIEFSLPHGNDLPDNGELRSFLVHTHSDDAIEVLETLCTKYGWSAFDHQLSELVNFDELKLDFPGEASLFDPSRETKVLSRLFVSSTPRDTVHGERRDAAEKFFNSFVQAMDLHSWSVGDFYHDEAVIYMSTSRSSRTRTGKAFKDELPTYLRAFHNDGIRVFSSSYSHVYYLDEPNGIRIKCVRTSYNCSPYELLVRPDEQGELKVFEERAEF